MPTPSAGAIFAPPWYAWLIIIPLVPIGLAIDKYKQWRWRNQQKPPCVGCEYGYEDCYTPDTRRK